MSKTIGSFPRNPQKNKELVIYYDPTGPELAPAITISEFDLISNKAKLVAEAAKAVYKIGEAIVLAKDLSEIATGAPENPPPTEPTSPTRPGTSTSHAPEFEVKSPIVVVGRFTIDVSKIQGAVSTKYEQPSDWNPFRQETTFTVVTDKGVIEYKAVEETSPFNDTLIVLEESKTFTPKISPSSTTATLPSKDPAGGTVNTPSTSIPKTAPAGSPTQPSEVRVVPGEYHEDEDGKIAPDEGGVDSTAALALREIMRKMGTITFDSAAAAESFFAAELAKGNITVGSTDQGLVASTAGPTDPLGVAKTLRQSGIKDEALISRSVVEVNSVLAGFENELAVIQSALAGLDVRSDDYSTRLNEVLQGWRGRLPTSMHESGAGLNGPSVPSIRVETPQGISISAGLGPVTTSDGQFQTPVGNIEPGYEFKATPIVSAFSEDIWKLKA